MAPNQDTKNGDAEMSGEDMLDALLSLEDYQVQNIQEMLRNEINIILKEKDVMLSDDVIKSGDLQNLGNLSFVTKKFLYQNQHTQIDLLNEDPAKLNEDSPDKIKKVILFLLSKTSDEVREKIINVLSNKMKEIFSAQSTPGHNTSTPDSSSQAPKSKSKVHDTTDSEEYKQVEPAHAAGQAHDAQAVDNSLWGRTKRFGTWIYTDFIDASSDTYWMKVGLNPKKGNHGDSHGAGHH